MRVIGRLKDLGTFRGGLTYSTDDICDENQGVLVLRSSNIQNGKLDFQDNVYVNCYIAKDLFVKKGDILICSRNGSAALVGKTAMIDSNIKASWGAFMMLFSTKYNSAYMNYLLSISIGKNKGRFATSTINQLTNSMLGNILVEYENSLSEQNRIVAYLDEKTAAIDKQVLLLEQKKEKYTLLRKSIIKKAVTEGVKGETRDWNFGRLKEQIKILESGKRPSNDKEEVLSIGGEHIQNGHFYLEHEMYVSEQTYSNSFGKIALGDILVVKDGATIGKCMYVDTMPHEKMLINEHVYRVVASKYYYYYIVSPMGQYWFRSRNMSSAQESIKQNTILNLPVPVPPLSEQRAIADYLDEKCAQIDAIVANINQQIEKYQLLRRALINEVVTGQRAVYIKQK